VAWAGEREDRGRTRGGDGTLRSSCRRRRERGEGERDVRAERGKGDRQLGFHHGRAGFYRSACEKTRMPSVGHGNYRRWHELGGSLDPTAHIVSSEIQRPGSIHLTIQRLELVWTPNPTAENPNARGSSILVQTLRASPAVAPPRTRFFGVLGASRR
jgi:hypothetical protein